MFLVYVPLRIARTLAGLLFGFQLLALIPLLGYVATPQASMAALAAVFAVKLALVAVLAGVFFGLRILINWVHVKTSGVPHPAMAKVWSL